MERTLKLSNGVEMPRLGFGVFQIPEGPECERVVTEAIAAGYRLIDTASSYGNERSVGRAVKRAVETGLVRREELFITTKAFIEEMGEVKTREAFERSIDRLGLDRIDLYLVHMPLGDYHGAWRALEALYEAGRVRAIGVCNFGAARLMDLCFTSRIRPMVDQIECHPHYQRTAELEEIRSLGVVPQAWAPFAEGLKGTFTDPVLSRIAEKHGRTTAQVMLRWNLERGLSVIPKTVHAERMKENANVWDFALDDLDRADIAQLDTGAPSMLDVERPSEVKRLYD